MVHSFGGALEYLQDAGAILGIGSGHIDTELSLSGAHIAEGLKFASSFLIDWLRLQLAQTPGWPGDLPNFFLQMIRIYGVALYDIPVFSLIFRYPVEFGLGRYDQLPVVRAH